MTDLEIKDRLTSIVKELSIAVDELKKKNGIISTEILDLIDEINRLSVEV